MKIEIISGLNRKAPAAILLSARGQRILLDAGGALEPDEALWQVPADIDAVLLSHDHADHIAGLNRLPRDVPVYCSKVTAQALPAGHNVRYINVRGRFRIGEITVTTGSCGHAYGGVWFHLDIDGGVFYSGDISMESALFHFDLRHQPGLPWSMPLMVYMIFLSSSNWTSCVTIYCNRAYARFHPQAVRLNWLY